MVYLSFISFPTNPKDEERLLIYFQIINAGVKYDKYFSNYSMDLKKDIKFCSSCDYDID